jgi:hypothetical protein
MRQRTKDREDKRHEIEDKRQISRRHETEDKRQRRQET